MYVGDEVDWAAIDGAPLSVLVRLTEADGDVFEDTHRIQAFFHDYGRD